MDVADKLIVLAALGKGAVFCEMALITGVRRSSTARATKLTVVRAIQAKSLMLLEAQAHPAVWGLLEVVIQRLRQANTVLAEVLTPEGEDAIR